MRVFKVLVIVLILFSFNLTNAVKLETPNIENIYNSFIKKVEKKYKWNKEIEFLNKLNSTIYTILETRKLNNSQIVLLNDLIKLTNEKLFSIDFSNKSKIYSLRLSSHKITSWFKIKPKNSDFIFKENWVWYYYKYNGHLAFKKWAKITDRDLEFNKIYKDKTITFITSSWEVWYITDFQKIRLIANDIIYWVTDKYNLLKEIKDDKKKLFKNTDELFKNLREKTIEITKWKTRNEKIKAIYNYVLSNVSYPTQIDLKDFNIFSWISAYELKSWACEWYSKMFMYMLNFAWIWDTQVIRWFVIDSRDFPQVWHAWVRIWNDYYDPTFDDPVWLKHTKTLSEYKYFKLPKDLFYTNRYKYKDLPEYLRNENLNSRENIVMDNISKLSDKYINTNYNLLKPFKFRKANKIGRKEKITISNFNKLLPLYEVNNFKFKDTKWKENNISKFSYFKLKDDNIENLLRQLNYDLTWYYFFKWNNPDWNFDYRLWYNVVFN